MEKVVVFRDYQEQTSGDHNNLQKFARQSLDHLVNDAVTRSNRYAGFRVVKTAQVEVQVGSGRLYDQAGAVYNRASTLTQSMVPYLAAASKRIVTVSVYGQTNDADIQERDFLVNTETGATQPDAVPTTSARDAVLTFTAGSESADPQPPLIPATHAVIAYILLDTIQVVSITMQDGNEVKSTEGLHTRTTALEVFKAAIEPRVTSIASDVSALANKVGQAGSGRALIQLYRDVARVKSILEIPSDATDYGADRFLTTEDTDAGDSQSLGYDALTQEGIRFPDANASVRALSIFSANDPNAALNSGLLLPAYEHTLKMEIGPYHSDQGIAQYGFQTFDVVQRQMSRQRIRYGSIFTVCTNAQWWKSGTFDSTTGTFRKDGETFELVGLEANYGVGHEIFRLRQIWVDTYQEPYWDYVVVDHSITGAQVAQTFLVSNDMWMTRFGFYLTSVAANENIFLTICEVTNGVPDLKKAVLQQTVPYASLLANNWTVVTTIPTFLAAGKRYAAVLTSSANHKVGMAYGQSYLDGTFFYSTDGAYYQGDLTKDMMIQVWGAKFNASQVTIELEALNLDGGIRNIDILGSMVVPQSTDLIFEVQPGGSGAWHPLKSEDLTAFALTPPLCRFRARFDGTRDVMPGLMLTGSEVKLSRPKVLFKHISKPRTLAGASDKITIVLTAEDFDETPHDLACRLRVGSTWETPDTTVTTLLSAEDKRISREFRFDLPAPTTAFTIEITGSTNSAANTFHVAERIYYAGV